MPPQTAFDSIYNNREILKYNEKVVIEEIQLLRELVAELLPKKGNPLDPKLAASQSTDAIFSQLTKNFWNAPVVRPLATDTALIETLTKKYKDLEKQKDELTSAYGTLTNQVDAIYRKLPLSYAGYVGTVINVLSHQTARIADFVATYAGGNPLSSKITAQQQEIESLKNQLEIANGKLKTSQDESLELRNRMAKQHQSLSDVLPADVRAQCNHGKSMAEVASAHIKSLAEKNVEMEGVRRQAARAHEIITNTSQKLAKCFPYEARFNGPNIPAGTSVEDHVVNTYQQMKTDLALARQQRDEAVKAKDVAQGTEAVKAKLESLAGRIPDLPDGKKRYHYGNAEWRISEWLGDAKSIVEDKDLLTAMQTKFPDNFHALVLDGNITLCNHKSLPIGVHGKAKAIPLRDALKQIVAELK